MSAIQCRRAALAGAALTLLLVLASAGAARPASADPPLQAAGGEHADRPVPPSDGQGRLEAELERSRACLRAQSILIAAMRGDVSREALGYGAALFDDAGCDEIDPTTASTYAIVLLGIDPDEGEDI